jgi:hypothetical protein
VTRAITDVEEIRRKFANSIAALVQLQSFDLHGGYGWRDLRVLTAKCGSL